MTPFELVLSRLEGVISSGAGRMAKCPAHEDSSPSLSVTEAQDGRVLVHCHAGCSFAEIVKASGLEKSDFFTHWTRLSNPRIDDRIDEAYPYRSEAGDLLYEVVRLKPKDFRQRRPDGKGGWVWSTNGVRRVPYRLPELVSGNPTIPVFIAEGEKDVDTLVTLGFVATTNPGGAGKWRSEFNGFFSGRDVVIVPDRDETGKRHAESVADELLAVAKSVRLVELPGNLKGHPVKDVSDFVGAGGLASELQELADRSEILVAGFRHKEKAATRNSGLTLISMAELLARPEEEHSWLVDGLLPTAGSSLVAARPKVGKTTFARNLVSRVSRGEEFLWRKVRAGPVVYLALEDKAAELQRQFRLLGATGEEPIQFHIGSSPEDGVEPLADCIAKYHAVLAVVDPLLKFVRVKDANDYAELSRALEPLTDLARRTGCHILAVHHQSKGDRGDGESILGSTAIFAAVDTAIVMIKRDEQREISTIQRYGAALPPTVLQFNQDTGEIALAETVEIARLERRTQEILQLLDEEEKLRENEIKDAFPDPALTGKALRVLVKETRIGRDGAGKRGQPFLYSKVLRGS